MLLFLLQFKKKSLSEILFWGTTEDFLVAQGGGGDAGFAGRGRGGGVGVAGRGVRPRPAHTAGGRAVAAAPAARPPVQGQGRVHLFSYKNDLSCLCFW